MTNRRKRMGIIPQVAILFAIGVLATGIITYLAQHLLSDASVNRYMESVAADIASDVKLAVTEYPAYEWLMRYWYEHDDELDIEYDAVFAQGTQTEEKCRLFSERHPEIQLRYADTQQIEALPEEDQKLYAEIIYSWLITRIDQIKAAYKTDFLFCVLTDETYTTQYFLFSAGAPGAVRGRNYEEIYTLGTTVSIADNEDQQDAMRSAQDNMGHLAEAGDYVDYYAYLGSMDGMPALIGLTYNLSALKADINNQTKRETALAIAHQILLSLLCLGLLYMFVLRPLKKVQQNIRLYKQTKNSADLEDETAQVLVHNEIGDLSEDVMDLAHEMDDYTERIASVTAEKERIGTELSLASRIQEDMLPNVFPPFPGRTDFDIFASMDPAKEVGGDFYDFFMLDDDHLAMVIADVSGKGVPAALFMMVSMILIHQTAAKEKSPARVLETVNDLICSNNREEMFVSVWLGVLDLKSGVVTACNAGHEYPALKDPDGHFEIIKAKHGFVVGGMAGVKYREYELQLKPGSKLFLYTDGVPEASNAANELFGLERTVSALRRAEDGAPEEILRAVTDAVQDFAGDAPQFDDITMICFHYKGIEASAQTD
ncbi:MAG: PP2C family protein-serine/threonine phosphatase [Firmicutes bacterium]|nr:PP2C family protein-serine/threonine phosphatase [Bacillota bacterium]